MLSTIGVQKMPGAMVITRTPMRPNSRAIGSVMPTTPPFEAEYAAWPIWPSKAATEAVLTITPRSPSSPAALCCIRSAAPLATLKLPTRFTITVLANCFSGIAPSRPSTRPAPRMPAQFTATLRPPRNSFADARLACTLASSLTSVRKYFALPAPSAATASAALSSLMSNKATLPPFFTRCSATAKPRPETPPVTTARTSLSFMGIPGGKPAFYQLQVQQVEGIAAAMAGGTHRAGQALETAALVQFHGRVHAAQGLEVAAPEAMRTGRVQAHLHHRGPGAEAAHLRQEVHLAQFAHVRVAVDQRRHARAAQHFAVLFDDEIGTAWFRIGPAHPVHFRVVDREALAGGAELGHHGADDLRDARVVARLDVADRKIHAAELATVTLLPLERPSSADSQRPVSTSLSRSTPVTMPRPSSM